MLSKYLIRTFEQLLSNLYHNRRKILKKFKDFESIVNIYVNNVIMISERKRNNIHKKYGNTWWQVEKGFISNHIVCK